MTGTLTPPLPPEAAPPVDRKAVKAAKKASKRGTSRPDQSDEKWYQREFFLGRTVKAEDVMNFSRQAASFMRAGIPILDLDLAIAELRHAADLGLRLVSLPTGVPDGLPDYNRDDWEPLWAAAEEAGMVLGFHIGSDNDGGGNTPFRGPGGAVLNVPAPFCHRSRTFPSNEPTLVGVKSSAAENQVTGW